MVTAFPSGMEESLGAPRAAQRADPFHFAAWRGHFCAGLFVIPFLVMLAVPGAMMMIHAGVGNELGQVSAVAVTGGVAPVSQQAEAALAAVPGATLDAYVVPEAAGRPSHFTMTEGDTALSAAVDPHTAEGLAASDTVQTLRGISEKMHGTLFIGTFGDRLIEIAAALALPFSAPLFAREAHGVRPRRPPTPSRSPTASPGRPVLERRSLAASW